MSGHDDTTAQCDEGGNGDVPAPFRAAWVELANSGLGTPIPLPVGKKHPPPEGVTGRDGKAISPAACGEIARRTPCANIAIRLAESVVGVDVDHYGKKRGGDTLAAREAEWGSLPPTWWSSAREAPSGIRLFLVPHGTRFVSAVGEHVETVQHTHRYVVTAPSWNPKAGTRYEWHDPSGEVGSCPEIDDLTPLPWSWLTGLVDATIHSSVGAVDDDAVKEFTARCGGRYQRSTSPKFKGLKAILRSPLTGARHDRLVSVSTLAACESAAGHYPFRAAVAEIRSWWLAVVKDEPRRHDREFGDALRWAVAQADAQYQVLGGGS